MLFRSIGIDASRAFLKWRTGIEEYAYQTIKHLTTTIPASEEVVLYVRKKLSMKQGRFAMEMPEIDFTLPDNWRVRGIWAPRFWTQIGLSFEVLLHAQDALFVPAHTVPIIHPKRSIVTVHGLEYEFCQAAYSFWERLYMRFSIRHSCRVASAIVCVSENTKRDVMRLYDTPAEKIHVVYEGYEATIPADQESQEAEEEPYLLFIGRLEERKNISRIIEAFDILKEQRQIPHRLVLAGKPGYGYGKITNALRESRYRKKIVLPGYISEKEKWKLLKHADIFLFPTLYEGFGIPVLEAQSVGTPVVTSDISSLPEVGGEGAIYVDPMSVENIADGIWKVLDDRAFRDGIIQKAAHNVDRFSWEKCALGVSSVIHQP